MPNNRPKLFNTQIIFSPILNDFEALLVLKQTRKKADKKVNGRIRVILCTIVAIKAYLPNYFISFYLKQNSHFTTCISFWIIPTCFASPNFIYQLFSSRLVQSVYFQSKFSNAFSWGEYKLTLANSVHFAVCWRRTVANVC